MGGVLLLNEEQTGAYIKILCCLWIQGNSISSELETLSRGASIPLQVLDRVWPAIKDKFVIENGNVTHARFSAMMDLSDKNRLNGVCGGRPATTQSKTQNRTQTKTQSKPNALKYEERRMKSEEEDWEFPTGWDTPEARRALDDWAEMRKRKRVPVRSKRSTSKIFKQFDSVQHLIAVCEICEANEWQGLKPSYVSSGNTGSINLTAAQKREANMIDVRSRIVARSQFTQSQKGIGNDGT